MEWSELTHIFKRYIEKEGNTSCIDNKPQGTVKKPENTVPTGMFLGVNQYGEEGTNKDNIDQFLYRFQVNGEVILLKIEESLGADEPYSIQNILKEGYFYHIVWKDGVLIDAKEILTEGDIYNTPVSGIPGEKTIGNFLKTAMEPVGTTLYVYGGGWNWQDEGASIQAKTIGISNDWVRFFNEQDENYTYRDKDDDVEKKNPKTSFYPYGGYNEYYYAGLDCSAYVGWTLYNCMNTDSNGEGMVSSATGFAKQMADLGLGTWTQDVKSPDGTSDYAMKPGDIMSINGHVWISLGTCRDNSVIIVHSTPSKSRAAQPGGGVQISAVGSSEDCEAYQFADYYMSTFFPDWYARYPVCLKNPEDYFSIQGDRTGKFRWMIHTENGFSDPDGCQEMTAEEVFAFLFG